MGLWLALLAVLLAPAAAFAVPWEGLATALREPGLVSERFRDDLARFYFARGYQPLWFDDAVLSDRADALRAVLQQADSEGLNPGDYLSDALRWSCAADSRQPLACELLLVDSLLRYASDVGYGSLRAADVDPQWHIPQHTLPVEVLLTAVADSADLKGLLSELPPPHAQYQKLRDALAAYRRAASCGRWLAIPDGPTLRPGERDPRVLVLRERLGDEQPELLASFDPELYDTELEEAVAAFQARHGLEQDGIVGALTLVALNVSREERIAQLRLNMERWRWLPRDLAPTHIQVNLAGFELTLVQAGQPPLQLRVISGRPDRTSPAFASRITQLIINPDWTVPRRLAVEDMLPQLRRDPLALRNKGIQVLQRQNGVLVEVDPTGIDWHRYHKDYFPFLLRQSPGEHNSLGRLKFGMPNRFDVYLHDTPAKGLFRKPVRTFSSGCVRVEHPLQLASRLMGDEPQAGAEELLRRIQSGETETLTIKPGVPVYLVYLTAWVDETGNLQLRNDVYGRNLQMRDRFSFP